MSIPWWKFDKMLADRYGGDALFPSDHLIAQIRTLGG